MPTTATAVQLSQECSNEALLQLSTEIAGYHKYKHRLGLSSADIDEIDNDPRNFYSVQGKFYTALLKWKSISIDFDNPSNSTATYGRLVEIAATFKDGEAIRGIHKASVKHASEIPLYSQEYIERVSNVGILMYAESNVTSCICHGQRDVIYSTTFTIQSTNSKPMRDTGSHVTFCIHLMYSTILSLYYRI